MTIQDALADAKDITPCWMKAAAMANKGTSTSPACAYYNDEIQAAMKEFDPRRGHPQHRLADRQRQSVEKNHAG